MKEKQKVALITGASRGIGKAIAIGLAKTGYRVVLTGRSLNDLEKVAREIQDFSSPEPFVYQLDISNSQQITETIKKIVKETGQIDVLVNNAGIFFDGSLSLSEEKFKSLLDVNLTAQFVILQEVVPVMKIQKTGYIFNISSRAGVIGFAGNAGYVASKFGFVGLSQSLYRELTPQGIKVTAICPSWVNTRMAYEAGTPAEPEEMIQPEDIFETIKWLLSLSPGASVKEIVVDAPKSIH
ncbi:SDR family NAD(P)-dependent oxidoreductase [Maribellus comscasis]|uniref:SDR family NAD(P)-dependent oxidoreductase n=1 Tax=Maribellus comscasis TaxID=2681766 RepID=A0A6I6JRF3_9BACT|nr:SDR family oxidoreductase [Maribellus comscasis]QGY44991.1 SDR family NAD(P)-dependent oxidoreductase [Maribellus comscasis]